MTDRSDLDAALRKQIGRYKQARMFTDDLKGNALLAVLDLATSLDADPALNDLNIGEWIRGTIAREMQTKENGFLD